ncbi:MAG: DUF262 domain-containing protein [Cytophagaceae bacterium]|nr:DUF262 domain-containing protein [Cytophagaceae bacterium]
MGTGHLLDTKTVSFNDILGNGKIYKVPQFQRDYSWELDNWEDLWNDIEIAEKNNSPHYMGSVVLQSSNGKEFSIIDGQQRFTTLSLLTLAVIDAISKIAENGKNNVDENFERKEILMRQYIGQKDPSSLTYSSKLFLNENNDGFFQTRLIAFKEPINVKKLSDSEKLLWEGYLFFQEKIKNKFKDEDGSKLASFINNIAGELMMFIQITVKDELNAYTVFETLNSRGVELTSTDLLKNYLFSLVAKSNSDLKQIKHQWKKIIDTIGLKEFPNFLRYFLLGTRKQITKEYLFKEIKSFVRSGEDVFKLLEELESNAYYYVALSSPDDELWSLDKENKSNITILKAFKVTQWKPLLMVALKKFDESSVKRLINSIVTISFRYSVISKLQTNEMEKVYSKASINLYFSENPNLKSVLNDLKAIYVDDENFRYNFSFKQFITNNSTEKKILRYILYKLESQISGGHNFDFELDNGTIEHILPESYSEAWQEEFSEDEFYKNVYLLGNLTLLEMSKNNKDASDKGFEEKRKCFLQVNIRLLILLIIIHGIPRV